MEKVDMANVDLKTALLNLRDIRHTRRSDLYIVVMGLVLVVFLIYVYVPLARRTMQEGAQLGEVRQRLQEAQATVSSFGGYKQTNARLKDRLEDFRKSRVSDKEYSELLGVLIAAGKKTGAR
jgi:Tfp pilus assembly protein PilO